MRHKEAFVADLALKSGDILFRDALTARRENEFAMADTAMDMAQECYAHAVKNERVSTPRQLARGYFGLALTAAASGEIWKADHRLGRGLRWSQGLPPAERISLEKTMLARLQELGGEDPSSAFTCRQLSNTVITGFLVPQTQLLSLAEHLVDLAHETLLRGYEGPGRKGVRVAWEAYNHPALDPEYPFHALEARARIAAGLAITGVDSSPDWTPRDIREQLAVAVEAAMMVDKSRSAEEPSLTLAMVSKLQTTQSAYTKVGLDKLASAVEQMLGEVWNSVTVQQVIAGPLAAVPGMGAQGHALA